MRQAVAREVARALAGALFAVACVGSAHALVYDTVVGNSFTVGDGYFNRNTTSAHFTLEPLLALDVGSSITLPLEVTLGVTLSVDANGGQVSPASGPEAGAGLARIELSNDAQSLPNGQIQNGTWTTVLQLGSTIARASFGTVTQDFPAFPPALVQPNSSYRYVRVVFDGVVTDGDSVGLSAGVQIIPEPDTWAMLVAGLIGIAFIARKRLA